MRCWTSQELARFLGLVQGDRYYVAWYFLATTGTRRGEALGLRWSDVDLNGARASIRQTVTAVEHKVLIAPRTKTGGGRAVDLDAGTVALLCTHRVRQAEEMFKLGLRPEDATLVFCHPDGRPYHPERFSREFDRRLDRHHFEPRITLHGLRHTWATLALASGVPTKVVSERLGHSTTAITENVYSHVTPTMQIEAAETVARLIFGHS
jgi:integrase